MRRKSWLPRRRELIIASLTIALFVFVGSFTAASVHAASVASDTVQADNSGSLPGLSVLMWVLPLLLLGAVTENKPILRQVGERISVPVAASTTIYEGTMFFINAAGYAVGDTGTGANRFGGIAIAKADNSSGAAGDVRVEGWRTGVFELVGSSFSQADVGKVAYASDNWTITTTYSASAVRLGLVQEYVSATNLRVAIDGSVGDGLEYAAVAASTAISATSSETAFDNAHSIPANSLRPGDVIRVRAQLVATATNSTDTLDMQLRLGTTDILATGAVDVANGDIGYIDADIVVRTIGASGTMVAAGITALGVPGTVTGKPKFMASTTLDTTAAISVNVSVTWSSTNAGNSCRLDIMDVQILRKR